MMHLDHDENVAHVHEHVHADGTVHTHEHAHPHEHSHDGGCGVHCGEEMNCAGCGHAHVSPREELVALMKYMVGHNAAHANELAQLAKQLDSIGEKAAYEQIMLAVSDFEKGNLRLSTVLASLQA